MSQLAYKKIGWSYTKQLGVGTGMRGTYEAAVPKSGIPNAEEAVAFVLLDKQIPQYGERLSQKMDLYCTSQTAELSDVGGNDWIVRVTCEFLPGHMLGSGYTLRSRGCVSSVTTCRDWAGGLLQVDYTPTVPEGSPAQPTQGGEIQILFPGMDSVATGVSEAADPMALAGPWLGKCNSSPAWGYGSYQILCTGITWEPISKTTTPPKYRFEFSFQVQLSLPGSGQLGWDQYIYWRDARGRIPWDASINTGMSITVGTGGDPGVVAPTYGDYTGPTGSITGGNGIAHVFPYPSIDFTTTLPLGVAP